jgi:hypothetical protein
VHIIPHIKINCDIQFRALKLDSSFLNKTEDHAHSSRATFRTSPYLVIRRMKKRVPKSLPCPVSAMSMTELEAMIADFNKLPPTEIPRATTYAQAPEAEMPSSPFCGIMMLHVDNNFGIIRRCITKSRVNHATAILAMFGLGLLPRSAGEAQLFLTSTNPLHLSGPQVSTCQIHSKTTVSVSHNLSDAPAFFIYSWDTILVATFVLLSHVLVMIFLNIPWLFSRKHSRSVMQFVPFKHPRNIQDSCSLLMTSCTPASDTCMIQPLTSAINHDGINACPSISKDCIRACASINLEASYPEHRVGMIDSGCNDIVCLGTTKK